MVVVLIDLAKASIPHLWSISALNGLAAAGAIMWVPGSIAFLLPVAWIIGQMLSPQVHSAARSAAEQAPDR